jgi:hypothetical protein
VENEWLGVTFVAKLLQSIVVAARITGDIVVIIIVIILFIIIIIIIISIIAAAARRRFDARRAIDEIARVDVRVGIRREAGGGLEQRRPVDRFEERVSSHFARTYS